MQVFVIRHAAAVPRSSKIDDASRPLTDRGRRQWRRAVHGFRRLGVRFVRVCHSPWLRAVETANVLIAETGGESVVTHRLAEPPTPALLRELKGDCAALVGHQPWLGQLVGLLVFARRDSGIWLDLGKGAIVWLEGEPRAGRMTLRAVLPQKVLRALR
jgi:phosphohistidine phosphatase